MARVYGPLHSDDASGSIKGGTTFSKWKGRNYVRARVTPSNPRTAAQTGNRAMFAFLAAFWTGFTQAMKDSWSEVAAATNVTLYNAYMGTNLKRWQSFKSPTKEYPAAETACALTISAHTFTGGTGLATLSITPSAATDIWGFVILRDLAAIVTPAWNLACAVIPANGANAVTYVDSPLAAGTYHYRVAAINKDGSMGTVLADATAVVT
jgi:hypothetical protein